MATAPIRPLAWETPYAVGVAQEIAKRQKKKKKKERESWYLKHAKSKPGISNQPETPFQVMIQRLRILPNSEFANFIS